MNASVMPSGRADSRTGGPSTRASRRLSTGLGLVAASSLLLLAPAGPASAHVQIDPSTAPAGAEATILTFRVPDESATARTAKLEISLPTEEPLRFVRPEPVPGWTVTSTTAKLPKPVTRNGDTITEAVRSVTWTAAAGQGIAPGQFQRFALLLGPMPTTAQLVLPAVQTYDDGKVVHWDTVQAPGAAEPEHPAPAVALQASGSGSGSGMGTGMSMGSGSGSGSQEASGSQADSGTDGVALGLAGAALTVSLVTAGTVLLSGRRRSHQSAPGVGAAASGSDQGTADQSA